MSNRPYVEVFRELPSGALSAGLAGVVLIPGDPVKLNAQGLWVDATPEEAEATATQYAMKGAVAIVRKK